MLELIAQSDGNFLDDVVDVLPRLGVAVGILILGYLFAKLLRRILRKTFRRDHTESFARVMSKLAAALLFAGAFFGAAVVAFPSVQPVDLFAGLGIFSVALGFAFQDILENLLAGVLLLFRQPFQAGDQIAVMEQEGTVQGITIRETQIKTFDGKLVIIPNRDVYKSIISIQTHFEQRRIAFVVGIAYEDDIAAAREAITDALGNLEVAKSDPAPEALVVELGSATVNIEARFWTDPRQLEGREALNDGITAVKRELDERGIEMPCEIVALQATPSFKAAVQGDAELTPGGSVR